MSRRALLVHGLSSDAGSWWRVRAALEADGWDVGAVDLRGHGGNPPATGYRLAEYAADLPREAWDVAIGHSLGGAAVVLAALDPGFARRIVLLDPVLQVPEHLREAIIADQVAELDLDERSIAAAKPHWHERDRAAKLRGVRRVDPAAVTRSFTDNPGWDLVDEVRALAVPVLVLSGDPDEYTMLDPATARGLENVEYRVIRGAGHSPHRDRPEETIAAIRSFLD
jgi:pimeloyl-ACP methyl ester carboxylesterase